MFSGLPQPTRLDHSVRYHHRRQCVISGCVRCPRGASHTNSSHFIGGYLLVRSAYKYMLRGTGGRPLEVDIDQGLAVRVYVHGQSPRDEQTNTQKHSILISSVHGQSTGDSRASVTLAALGSCKLAGPYVETIAHRTLYLILSRHAMAERSAWGCVYNSCTAEDPPACTRSVVTSSYNFEGMRLLTMHENAVSYGRAVSRRTC